MKIIEKSPKVGTNKIMLNKFQFHDIRVTTAKIKNNIENQTKKVNDPKVQEVTK